MNSKKIILLVVIAGISYAVYYASQTMPIISGYSAKNMCSCTMLAGRLEAEWRELSLFSLGTEATSPHPLHPLGIQ